MRGNALAYTSLFPSWVFLVLFTAYVEKNFYVRYSWKVGNYWSAEERVSSEKFNTKFGKISLLTTNRQFDNRIDLEGKYSRRISVDV